MNSRILSIGQKFALPVVLIIIWWLIAARSQSVYFPPVPDILRALGDWFSSEFAQDFYLSMSNLLVGYFLAVVVGVGAGLVIGRIRILEVALNPLITFARSIPPAAILPFFILAMGATDWMRISVIAIGSLWPTLLSSIDGIRGIPPEVVDVTKVYKTSLLRKVFKVYLPAASPLILAGMKTSLAFSIVLVIVSEMLASTGGIGHFIFASQQYFDIPGLWAGTVVMGIIGYLLSELFFFAERRILAWSGEQ